VTNGKPAPYCDVKGNIDPHVGFEVRLPLAGWTQRFLQTGCGGYCGEVSLRVENATDCTPATNGEMVLAATNMGHSGGMGDAAWAVTDAQARIDFAYRGQHVTALAAKALTQKFYGQGPRYSYFSGCSDGGREALMEAQRFPNDFNGILAGAPALDFVTQNTYYFGWNDHINIGADGKGILTTDKLPILHKAVLAQCDAADGVKDGLISDPLGCHFDPGVTECKPGQDPSTCLTAAQVKVARDVYAGAHDSNGTRLTPGGLLPGSEKYWGGAFAASPGKDLSKALNGLAESAYEHFAFENGPPAGTTIRDLKFDRNGFEGATQLHGLYDATDADLSPFVAHGGKLIMYHGLYDQGMSPLNTIIYYTELQKIMSKSVVDNFARLYIFPGGYHCGRGEGPFHVSLLYTMMSWVEKSQAPYMLLASHQHSDTEDPEEDERQKAAAAAAVANGQAPAQPTRRPPPEAQQADPPDMTRPVFPYPLTAKYIGSGDPNDAKNFVAGPPSPLPASLLNWAGTSFYAPHQELWCTGSGATMSCKKTP
jgi:feruloyl esterase